MTAFDPGNRLIAALDVATDSQAYALAAQLSPHCALVKVGLELFTGYGPHLVRAMVGSGVRVMLDLKLHDIPETVGRTVTQLANLGVSLCTVHASDAAMLQAAVSAAENALTTSGQPRMRILAVTVLTSMSQDDLAQTGISGISIADLVKTRALLAAAAGCDGVVSSAQEAAILRGVVPSDFLLVTPGIRPEGGDAGDQKRVMTASAARAAGADMIVVGRPLRDAADPVAVAQKLVQEMSRKDHKV
jgi:orotidine-5'-phosphate decarboxylase